MFHESSSWYWTIELAVRLKLSKYGLREKLLFLGLFICQLPIFICIHFYYILLPISHQSLKKIGIILTDEQKKKKKKKQDLVFSELESCKRNKGIYFETLGTLWLFRTVWGYFEPLFKGMTKECTFHSHNYSFCP